MKYKKLSEFNLKIVGERDMDKFRGFVLGRISRKKAYPTPIESLCSTIFYLSVGNMILKEFGNLIKTWPKPK